MARTLTVQDAIQVLEEHAPLASQEDWDNGGLLLGDPKRSARRAVVSTDLTRAVLDAARKRKASLLVLHHPPIFPRGKGISSLTRTGNAHALSDLLLECAERGIAVLASHTSFDRSSEEAARAIAERLGVEPKGKLLPHGGEGELLKLRVFVPFSKLARVREALARAGAGHVGNYDSCSFSARGEGTFRGLPGSRPAHGKPGKLEKAGEAVLETVFPRGLRARVLRALRESHPYEEIAYDLLPCLQGGASRGFAPGIGYGFWGEFREPVSIPEWEARLRDAFRVEGIRATDCLSARRRIRRVSFSPGKGSGMAGAVRSLGCDAFVTGELDYHEALALARAGAGVWEVGHAQSERDTALLLARWLEKAGFVVSVEFSQLQSVRCRD